MRKLLVVGMISLGVIFIILRMAEVEQIANTFRKGDWRFLLFAVLIVLAWVVNVAASYWVVFRELGIEETFARLIPLTLATFSVNVIAPSAGMGGMAVLTGEARQRGYPASRAATAGILVLMFDYLGFFLFLILGLLVLFRRNNLSSVEIAATGVLVLIIAVIGFLLFTGMRSARTLGNILAGAARKLNRMLWPFIHREYLSEARASLFAQDTSEALNQLRSKPKNLILPAILGITNKALLLLILLLIFLAFNIPFSAGTIIAGFSIGYLFVIVSPTPAGVGFVEGGLTLALSTLYVPIGAAAVITLAYRGITFWLPLLAGLISFRYLMHGSRVQVPTGSE